MKSTNHNHWKKKLPYIIIFSLAGIAAITGIVMFLWNAILPDILQVNPVNYWQALGILILSKILFGGFKFGKKRKQHQRAAFMNMTDEQKAAFKAEWRSRCSKKD